MRLVVPFLKWPGGKRWLSSTLSPVLNAELKGTYFEPFLGGGALFLALRPKTAVLADSNSDLIEFLKTIKKTPDVVIRLVWRWSNTRECYYRVRDSVPRTATGRAARFLFLNRTCWGGIYRLNMRGEFNVPYGNSGRTICHRSDVLRAASAFRAAKLIAADFEVTIGKSSEGDVVYADPPYTTRGAGNGFIRYNESLFHWQDQQRLATVAAAAASRGVFVAVSGLNHFEFLNLYPSWWVAEFERSSRVSHAVESRGPVSEVVVFSRKPVQSALLAQNGLRQLK